jgi:hypothetical protein
MSELKWTEGCDALVDFVEEHGGSMGGETRGHLFNIVQNIIDGQLSSAPKGLTRDQMWKIADELWGEVRDFNTEALISEFIGAILESSGAPKEP